MSFLRNQASNRAVFGLPMSDRFGQTVRQPLRPFIAAEAFSWSEPQGFLGVPLSAKALSSSEAKEGVPAGANVHCLRPQGRVWTFESRLQREAVEGAQKPRQRAKGICLSRCLNPMTLKTSEGTLKGIWAETLHLKPKRSGNSRELSIDASSEFANMRLLQPLVWLTMRRSMIGPRRWKCLPHGELEGSHEETASSKRTEP